jgi:hypothetical protein
VNGAAPIANASVPNRNKLSLVINLHHSPWFYNALAHAFPTVGSSSVACTRDIKPSVAGVRRVRVVRDGAVTVMERSVKC